MDADIRCSAVLLQLFGLSRGDYITGMGNIYDRRPGVYLCRCLNFFALKHSLINLPLVRPLKIATRADTF
jgi:hypothetical protein